MRRLTRLLLSFAARCAPPHRQGWIAAMQRECDLIGADFEALLWAFGCAATALSERMKAMNAFVRFGRIGVAAVTALYAFLFAAAAIAAVAIIANGPDAYADRMAHHFSSIAIERLWQSMPLAVVVNSIVAAAYALAAYFLVRWRPLPFALVCTAIATTITVLNFQGLVQGVDSSIAHTVMNAIPLLLLAGAGAVFALMDRSGRQRLA